MIETDKSLSTNSETNKSEKDAKLPTHYNLTNITDEMLGSVTTFPANGNDYGQAVRTSARVIHKLRQPPAPVPEKKVPEVVVPAPLPKTPSQTRPHVKVQWANIEKSMFFDALNEFGRDFDAITNYINHKMKRKVTTEPNYKFSYHVRQLYYQMFQKCLKYLKFSDEVKKLAQELYTLINYGEMKRKIVCLNEKCFLKLHDLVYKGGVTIRFKGKTVRIKTPSCRALRRLNQVESSLEDIQLPPRVECILRPATIEAFGKVQDLAQNPRVRATLPLQRRLESFLQIMQHKWRSNNVRACEKYILGPIQNGRHKLLPEITEKTQNDIAQYKQKEPLLCLKPPKEAVISRPMVQLNELLSSYNLCLNSYEEKIGATVRGAPLCLEKINQLKETLKFHYKRVRHDSGTGTDKNISPDMKKIKQEEPAPVKVEAEVKPEEIAAEPMEIAKDKVTMTSSDASTTKLENELNCVPIKDESDSENQNRKDSESEASASTTVTATAPVTDVKPPVPAATTTSAPPTKKKVRDSFSLNSRLMKDNVNTYKSLLTEESLRKIREGWCLRNVGDVTIGDLYIVFGQEGKLIMEYHWVDENTMPSSAISDPKVPKCEVIPNEQQQEKYSKQLLGNRLKQLLTISSLVDRNKPIVNCTCGHICEKKIKMSNDFNDSGVFKQPAIPCRNVIADMNYRSNLNVPKHRPSKWLRNRIQRPRPYVGINHVPIQNAANHIVRNLYQNHVGSEASTSNGTSSSNKEVQIKDIIEEKINKLAQSSEKTSASSSSDKSGPSSSASSSVSPPNFHEFNESSRSSIRSLLDCLTEFNQNGSSFADGLDATTSSISPLKLLGESFGEAMDDDNFDNISLSSFLGHLDSVFENNKKSKSFKDNMDSNVSISSESLDFIARFDDIHKG